MPQSGLKDEREKNPNLDSQNFSLEVRAVIKTRKPDGSMFDQNTSLMNALSPG
uniref:Uncharacterized protein n=1 Tax=Arion vulgaris TaxID=1028688 RepID=A0A0B7BK53_9EUPU